MIVLEDLEALGLTCSIAILKKLKRMVWNALQSKSKLQLYVHETPKRKERIKGKNCTKNKE